MPYYTCEDINLVLTKIINLVLWQAAQKNITISMERSLKRPYKWLLDVDRVQ